METIPMVIGIVVLVAIAYSNYRYLKGGPREVVRKADEEFRQIRITDAPAAFCFDGQTADIVLEGRDYRDRSLTQVVRVRRYARNVSGEYFFFLSEGNGKPLFKHIEQQVAKAALGKRYIAP